MVVLTLVLALFSLDDVVTLHEQLGDAVSHALGSPDYVGARPWVVLYAPLLAAAALVLWRLADECVSARTTLRGGVALLVLAIGLELAGVGARWLDTHGGPSWPRASGSVLEEALELAGWVLVATGLTVVMARALAGVEPTRARC